MKTLSQLLNTNKKYPAAQLVLEHCLEDYKHVIVAYDKIYDKVNILIVCVCGILALLFNSPLTCLNIISMFFLIVALAILLQLLLSSSIKTFDSVGARNQGIYKWKEEDTACWMIDKYTRVTSDLRQKINEKYKTYNWSIILVLIGLTVKVIDVFMKG